MYWTQRWYFWDTINKRIKRPLFIVIKVLAFKSVKNKSNDVVFSLIVIKNKKNIKKFTTSYSNLVAYTSNMMKMIKVTLISG